MISWDWMRLDEIREDQMGSKEIRCNHQMILNAMRWEDGIKRNEIISSWISGDWIRWNILITLELIRWDQMRTDQIRSNWIGLDESKWDQMRLNYMVSYEIRWPQMTDEIRKDYMRLDETARARMRPHEIKHHWIW